MIADQALWEEFLAESEEHLDAIEGRLGRGEADRPAVDALFRGFHTLKGMGGALGATGLAALAHRCEDLLGAARAGKLVIAGAVAEALLAAVDALRRQRAALQAGGDEAAPAALLARLATLVDAPGAAPPPATAALPAATANPLLASFASVLEAEAGGLAALAEGTGATGTAASLAEGAGEVGLPRLRALLLTLAEVAGRPAALPALGVLRRAMLLLERRAGAPAGAGPLAAALGADGPGRLVPYLAAVAAALADAAPALAALARDAADAAFALDLSGAEAALRRVEDLADRPDDPEAAALLAMEAPALAEALRNAVAGGAAAVRALTPLAAAPVAPDPVLPADFAAALTPEGHRRAAAALAAGSSLWRLRLALGLPPELEAAAEAWLRGVGEVLTSRTLLDADPSRLDLLLASALPEAELRASLAAADPDGRALSALAPATLTVAGAPPRPAPAATMRVRQDTVDDILGRAAEVRAAALAVSEVLREGGAGDALAALGALERRLPGGPARALAAALDRLRDAQTALERAEARLTLGLRGLDDAVLALRVVPLATLFARLPRVVRAAAAAAGRAVDLVLEGEDVTLDRGVVELLADPLLHLLRNAVDHGIEPPAARRAAGKPERGTLRVRAERRAGGVRITVVDDGAGVDRAAVLRRAVARGLIREAEAAALPVERVHALLFRPGFSTREVVSETSGRGVGLDVVQDAVRRAGGAVELTSTPGAGTTFRLTLPLTAAVQPVLLVEEGGHPYALPAARVEAVLDHAAPPPGVAVLSLAAALGLPDTAAPGAIVLLRGRAGPLGLAVGRVRRRTDLLLRPLHPALAALPGVGGVGVLGNGDPVVVLEPDGLAAG